MIDLNRIAEIRNKIDQLNAEFVISCKDCLDNIKFTRLSHMYCHSRTVSVDIDNTNWMDVQEYIVLKDIILNWYNSLCNRYEKEGYTKLDSLEEAIDVFFDPFEWNSQKIICDLHYDTIQSDERVLIQDVN